MCRGQNVKDCTKPNLAPNPGKDQKQEGRQESQLSEWQKVIHTSCLTAVFRREVSRPSLKFREQIIAYNCFNYSDETEQKALGELCDLPEISPWDS